MAQLTTVYELKYGDRFYYASDKKKVVWQATSAYAQIMQLKGFKQWVRAVQIVSKTGKILQSKYSRTNTHVIVLRNILDNATTTI